MSLPEKLKCNNGCGNSKYIYTEVEGNPAGRCPECENILTTDESVLIEAIDDELIYEDRVFSS